MRSRLGVAMNGSERSVITSLYPELQQALDAADLLAERTEFYLRAETRNALGQVNDNYLRAAEGRLKTAIAASRQANKTWRESR